MINISLYSVQLELGYVGGMLPDIVDKASIP